MVSDTLNRIISAEKEAADRINFTEQKADQIISESRKQAEVLITSATNSGNSEAEILYKENDVLISELISNREKAALEEAADIKIKAQHTSEKAADIITRIIF